MRDRKLAAAGNDLTYVHHPDLIRGFPQFTRSSRVADRAVPDLADLIGKKLT